MSNVDRLRLPSSHSHPHPHSHSFNPSRCLVRCPLIHNRRLLYHLAKRSPLPSDHDNPASARPSVRRSSDFILRRPASCLKCCRFLQTYTRQRTEHNPQRDQYRQTQRNRTRKGQGIGGKKERKVRPQGHDISPAVSLAGVSQRPPHTHTPRRSAHIRNSRIVPSSNVWSERGAATGSPLLCPSLQFTASQLRSYHPARFFDIVSSTRFKRPAHHPRAATKCNQRKA